jgi:hypothetical protein
MGVFVKRKSDGYKKYDLQPFPTNVQDYEPPQDDQSLSEFLVESDGESNPGLGEEVCSKSVDGFVNEINTVGGEAYCNPVHSIVDGPIILTPEGSEQRSTENENCRPMRYETAFPSNTWNVEHPPASDGIPSFSSDDEESDRCLPEKELYQPIRYEMVAPPNTGKVNHPLASSLVSPSRMRTSPATTPRNRLHSSVPSLDTETGDKVDYIVDTSFPPSSLLDTKLSRDALSRATSITTNDPKCGSFEHCGYRDEVVSPSLSAPLPKRGILSTFSRFSRLVRSRSFRERPSAPSNNASMYSKMEDPPTRKMPKKSVFLEQDDDLGTLSSVSYQSKEESLISSAKISLDGTNTLAIVNDEARTLIDMWKRSAVNGKPILRFLAIFLSLSVIVTTISLMVLVDYIWTLSRVICSLYAILSASMIHILELRCRDEQVPSCLKKANRTQLGLRRLIVRHFNLFKLVWGRGCLYVFAGTMAIALDMLWAFIPGSLLVLLGCFSMAMGSHALERLDTLRTSFVDDAYLEDKFQDVDLDRNGKISEYEFGSLVWTIGLELTEYQIAIAFQSIDTKKKGYISYQQFRGWWFRDPSSKQNIVKPGNFLSRAPQNLKSQRKLRVQNRARNDTVEAMV